MCMPFLLLFNFGTRILNNVILFLYALFFICGINDNKTNWNLISEEKKDWFLWHCLYNPAIKEPHNTYMASGRCNTTVNAHGQWWISVFHKHSIPVCWAVRWVVLSVGSGSVVSVLKAFLWALWNLKSFHLCSDTVTTDNSELSHQPRLPAY